MPWKPLPAVAFAICVYPFQATHSHDLPLQIGDNIYIIEQGGYDNEWYRGYLVAPPSLLAGLTSDSGQQLEHRVFSGIFPRNCVEIRELLGENKSSADARAAAAEALEGKADDEAPLERRKSQAQYARRLSRALSRKRSTTDMQKKVRQVYIDASEPMPRDPNAPKPLAPVPMLRVGDEMGSAVEEPLVDEIASCLREWHDARLHEMLLARGYSQLVRVQELVKRVDTSRKQLMHDVMTMRELTTLREDTVWDLVAGNKMLNDEIIVRSPTEKGRILTADDSVIEMTRLQANMSILDRPPKPPADLHMQYHVLIDVHNLVGDFDTPAQLQIYLCVKEFGEKPKPVSENYAISLPLPDTPSKNPEDLTKVVFANLSATDIGIGSDSTQMYAVFKLIQDEPVRNALANEPLLGHQAKSSVSSGSGEPLQPPQKFASLKGRRSVFGSQKKSDSMLRSTSDNSRRPATGQSQRSNSDVRSTNSTIDPPSSHDTKVVKRTVGVGAVEVGRLAQQQSELDTKVAMWAPASSAANDKSDESHDWSEIIRELQRSVNGGYSRVGILKRFDVFATAFASTDIDTLIRNNPTLLHDVHMAEKLGFSGVPTHKRSDIYLTLSEPTIGRNAALQHSKFGNVPLAQRCQSNMANLQLTLEVRKGNGERIDDCIFTASNHQGHTAWRTTAVERGEAWNQTIKLAIPTEDVPGSHIVMSIADSPNFPFALSWIPLWEHDAFVRDGDHQVALYVYDEYSSSIIGGKGAYLALPPWHDKKNEPGYGTSATVSIRTYLCSTEYSQDPNLLGLLNWRNFHGAKLVELLERFSFVPEIEVVKLLGEIFDAHFEILHEYANSEAYEDVVFHNFVVIFGIARDRRFSLTNVIEHHARTRHDWPYASRCLVRAYLRLVSNPMDSEASRKLRETLKVGDQMLRLIVETQKERPENAGAEMNGDYDQRHPDFQQDLQNLFVALMALMRNPMPVLLGTQTLVVQHFHTWLPELAAFMPYEDILEVATNLLDACAHAKGKMILFRLILIINYSHLDIFKAPEIRTTLVANTFRWLAPYWGDCVNVTDQWRDQVRLCCSVVAAQMEELGEDTCQYVPKLVASYSALEKSQRKAKKSFSMLFPTSFPFPSKATAKEVGVDEAMLEISALLAAALTTQQRLYFDANQVDIPGVLLQALKVEQSVLKGQAFPRSWLSLHVSHHRFSINALERIFEVLVEFLPDSNAPDMEDAIEFDTEIWRAFFETLFAAVSSSALAMETFPEQKRRAIWKIAGDVREIGADLIRRSWDAIGWEADDESKKLHGFERIGGYQVQFVPELIAPIVELCLSVHGSLRNVAVEVLRTMIISNWEIDQDLAVIQSAMIECLDNLCRSQKVSESMLQTTFIDEMITQFQPLQNTVEDSLYLAVMEMFGRIEELLSMLASVHRGGAINEATRIVDTLRLMEFLKDVQSEEAYIRYVHQLASVQAAAGNHTEAGLALHMHAERLEWDPTTQLEEVAEPKLPAQSAFERKEALYFEMCEYFEKGKCWHRALAAYRELGHQYEHNTFDYSKLARSQRAIATIHEKIAKGDRISPRFFRVVYRGLGFSPNLRDKEFIFEGQPEDRQANFEERLQQLHPIAHITRAEKETDVEGQHLLVYPVSANKDLRHMLYQRTKVSQSAREYILLSNPSRFATTSRQLQQDVPVTEQAVEKEIYTTAEPFPTLLSRSEIVATEAVMLSPVEAAVERTTRKTQEILSLEKRVSSGEDESAMNRLSDELLLSVDPQSDSSVSRYRSLLPRAQQGDAASGDDEYAMLEQEEEPLGPMQNALRVALLDHTLAIRRCLSLYTSSAYVATKAELVPRFEATYEVEITTLFPNGDGLMDEASRRSSLEERRARASTRTADQAAPGAQQDQAPADGSQDPPRTHSRRRSLPFLRRMASGNTRQPNGEPEEGGGRATSRQSSRSRTRGESLTRRLSFFRNEQQQHEAGLKPGSSAGGSTLHANGTAGAEGGGSLKKRLSFLKATGGSGLGGGGGGEVY
ncbi:Deoxycytidine kinase 1 [Saxophila tyrrhenica]|uniref:Deoxycytidine kinase 1 n=1 Tax=Saxophila tyrrhenica TaxID=1690608 RepID=A0AAV9PQG0_9PEZI|nr:Deoxycytidine kinase 1 [Saxophila tyrrhenica]